MRAVELRVIVSTDDESAGAVDRIESTVRRALGQWIDPQRVYVEQAVTK
jgi:hypothetical protein